MVFHLLGAISINGKSAKPSDSSMISSIKSRGVVVFHLLGAMCKKIACFLTYSGFFGIPEFRTNFSPSDGKILLGQTDTLIRQRINSGINLSKVLTSDGCFWFMAMGKA